MPVFRKDKWFPTTALIFVLILNAGCLSFNNSNYNAMPQTRLDPPSSDSDALVCFESACINAELAETREERSKGLMYREQLGEREGMLFVFESEGIHSFWMKNTLIPLDMIWIDAKMEVAHIENAVPCTTANCKFYTPNAPAKYVLETNAGFAEKNGIKIGDTVSMPVG